MSPVIDIDDLDRGENSHQFIGADHDVPVSMFLVHSAPGKGPWLTATRIRSCSSSRAAKATFRVGEDVIVAEAGIIVIAPAGMPHAFTNTGVGELRMVNIHTASEMETKWLEDLTARRRA